MDQENYENWLSLYVEQRKALIDYAAKLTGIRDVAEDIVQEAFMICIARKDRNYHITKAFLFTVVRNLVYNYRRHLAVHSKGHPDDYPWWTRYQAMESPELQVVIVDQAKVAAQAIGKLPTKMRQVVEMYRFDGLTLQEISSRLGISTATPHRFPSVRSTRIWLRSCR